MRIAWRAGDIPSRVSAAASGALGDAPRGLRLARIVPMLALPCGGRPSLRRRGRPHPLRVVFPHHLCHSLPCSVRASAPERAPAAAAVCSGGRARASSRVPEGAPRGGPAACAGLCERASACLRARGPCSVCVHASPSSRSREDPGGTPSCPPPTCSLVLRLRRGCFSAVLATSLRPGRPSHSGEGPDVGAQRTKMKPRVCWYPCTVPFPEACSFQTSFSL